MYNHVSHRAVVVHGIWNTAAHQSLTTSLPVSIHASYNVPWDPVNADRWYIPEADRLSTVGQLLDRVAERERDWWSRYVDINRDV
jgi:hypothetical protein